jgi:Protein of unknown function (DUF4238)
VNKRRHHFVPQALSKNFSLDGETLFVYDVVEDRIFRTNPRDIFVARDFHAFPLDEQRIDYDWVEDQLSQFEQKGTEALRKYITSRDINNDELYWIAAFWALQYLRTPLVRQNAAEFMKETIKSVARLLDKKGKFPPVPEEMRKYGDSVANLVNRGALKIQIRKHITMLTFTATPEVSRLLFFMNWMLLESRDSDYFVLSDNPCSVYDEGYRLGLGIDVTGPSVEIGLPVSKNHALVASWKDASPFVKAGTKKVREMNYRTALFGERFFVYPIRSTALMRMLKARYGEHPGADVQAIPREAGGDYIVSRNLGFTTERANRLYNGLRPLV